VDIPAFAICYFYRELEVLDSKMCVARHGTVNEGFMRRAKPDTGLKFIILLALAGRLVQHSL
jgi:hypothetical protein